MVYDHPKISVVLSSFNGAQFIEEQLISIIEQTIKPDEIIVSVSNGNLLEKKLIYLKNLRQAIK